MKVTQLFLLFLFIGTELIAQYLPIDSINDFKLEWNDEFDYPDSQLDLKWESQNSASGGFVLCSRWRENAVVNNGILELQAKKENRGGQEWTAASIWTKQKFHYGYYECRYKYAGATGTNNSFWMWPRSGVPDGDKKFELDVNEGHYPNEVNTNIHNWTDKKEDGSHDVWPQAFLLGGFEAKASYTHILDNTITTSKIRFSSTHLTHFHIGEFRVYEPNAAGYPQNATSNTADTEVAGLINHSRAASTQITSSGFYPVSGRNTEVQNVANGLNTGTNPSWIAPATGEKWLEITFNEPKDVGCIQFTNGWYGGGIWKALINNYKIEYHNGTEWITLEEFDQTNGADFSLDYHTYGMLWNENVVNYYFDGELLRSFSHTEIISPMHIYLSLAILSDNIAGPVTDAIDGTSMKVDYVRYYTKVNHTLKERVQSDRFKLFPNPVKNKLYVENLQGLGNLKIYDAQGQLLIRKQELYGHYIDVSSLENGIYCFVADGRNRTESQLFIKQ